MNANIIHFLKALISQRGMKFTLISGKAGIEYQSGKRGTTVHTLRKCLLMANSNRL